MKKRCRCPPTLQGVLLRNVSRAADSSRNRGGGREMAARQYNRGASVSLRAEIPQPLHLRNPGPYGFAAGFHCLRYVKHMEMLWRSSDGPTPLNRWSTRLNNTGVFNDQGSSALAAAFFHWRQGRGLPAG